MALDQFKLLAQVTLAAGGIDAATTTLPLVSGQAALKLPSAGPFNLVVWDWTAHGDNAANDPNAESILVPLSYAGGDTITGCTRAQEGTTAKAHNTAGHIYKAVLHLGTTFVDKLIRRNTDNYFVATNISAGKPTLGVGSMNSITEVFEVERILAGQSVMGSFRNADNTNAASHAIVRVLSGGGSGGDPILSLKIGTVTEWVIALDNDAGDVLKIEKSTGPGSSPFITLSDLGVALSKELLLEHNDTTSGSSHARVRIKSGGASGGDAYLSFENGVNTWSIGEDNSDGDKFKASLSGGLGTSDYLIIDLEGDVGLGGDPGSSKLYVTKSSGVLSVTIDQAAVADCFLNLGVTVSGADQYIRFTRAAAQDWALGSDSSDSNAFVLSESTAPGATNKIKVEAGNGRVLVSKLAVDVIATASLPAAGSTQDGRLVIEDAGAGDRNLILYAGGQRFRIDGGANF